MELSSNSDYIVIEVWTVVDMARLDQNLSFTYPVERSVQRFRELIIYISQVCADDPQFGAIKLNKILYHADFRAFERFGVPLTGVRYFRLSKGPAPRALVPVRRELESEGALGVDKVLFGGYEQHRTIALRDPVLSHFTSDEIQIVDEVIRELWDQNATEVSNASHDIRWRVLHDNVDMPYELAFLSGDEITQDEIKRTEELVGEFGWEA